MKKIEIFDPAMCCGTGLGGPVIDPELMQMATLTYELNERGMSIQRYGLTSAPQAFVANPTISELLRTQGPDILPVVLLDGEVVKTGAYPSKEELSAWLGIEI